MYFLVFSLLAVLALIMMLEMLLPMFLAKVLESLLLSCSCKENDASSHDYSNEESTSNDHLYPRHVIFLYLKVKHFNSCFHSDRSYFKIRIRCWRQISSEIINRIGTISSENVHITTINDQ